MPTVTNTATGNSAQCGDGDELKDVAQANGLGIAFGCENGICSTCLIQVTKGKENLSEPTEQEEFTLEARGVEPGETRLACQCKVKGDVEFEQ